MPTVSDAPGPMQEKWKRVKGMLEPASRQLRQHAHRPLHGTLNNWEVEETIQSTEYREKTTAQMKQLTGWRVWIRVAAPSSKHRWITGQNMADQSHRPSRCNKNNSDRKSVMRGEKKTDLWNHFHNKCLPFCCRNKRSKRRITVEMLIETEGHWDSRSIVKWIEMEMWTEKGEEWDTACAKHAQNDKTNSNSEEMEILSSHQKWNAWRRVVNWREKSGCTHIRRLGCWRVGSCSDSLHTKRTLKQTSPVKTKSQKQIRKN